MYEQLFKNILFLAGVQPVNLTPNKVHPMMCLAYEKGCALQFKYWLLRNGGDRMPESTVKALENWRPLVLVS